VLWLTLQRYGVPVRGRSATSLGVEVDLEALRTYNLSNLRTYWQGQGEAIRRFVAGLESGSEVDAEYAAWVLLGPARLHYTLAETDIVSKSGAGAYVATRFPEYAQLAQRAVRWRGGGAEIFTAGDLSAAATLIDLIADDAWRRWG
jgi:aminoglycoside adenylyltransferase-like protein